MIRSDYLLRMAEQMASVIAQLMFGKQAEDPAQCSVALQTASLQFLGLGYEIVEGLSEDDLVMLFTGKDGLDITKCFLAADLIRTHAEALEKTGRSVAAGEKYTRSLRFYLEAYPHLPGLAREPAAERIHEILGKVRDARPSAGTLASLVVFYQETGAYAQAEDALFSLADADRETAGDSGKALYTFLRELPDDKLARGNLPRAEVEEGFAAFREKLRG